MTPLTDQKQASEPSNTQSLTLCSACHKNILPEYYFCPNCGNKLVETPLSTTFMSQFWLYIFSIILPSICFLFVTRWKGNIYAKSSDPAAKRIGYIAWALLISSTIITFWFAYYVTQKTMEILNANIN